MIHNPSDDRTTEVLVLGRDEERNRLSPKFAGSQLNAKRLMAKQTMPSGWDAANKTTPRSNGRILRNLVAERGL